MRAIVEHAYGSIDVLRFHDIDKPQLNADGCSCGSTQPLSTTETWPTVLANMQVRRRGYRPGSGCPRPAWSRNAARNVE